MPQNPADRRLRHRQSGRVVLPFALGAGACHVQKERVPATYKTGLLYTDFWSAYTEVLPEAQHRATGKGAGQTCHIERFNLILRQRLARFVRRTLSFSKTDEMHENCLRLFLNEYNRQKAGQPTKHQPKRCRLI